MSQLHQSDNYISQQIEALSKSNWQDQILILNSIPINQNLIKLINHRNYSSQIANLFAPLNPRSKLITTLSDFLTNLFSNYSNQLISLANILITTDCLLRLLGNGNKVIASSINQIIKCIISNTDYKQKSKLIKYVNVLQQQFLHSKNIYVRQKISLYFILISTSYYYNTKQSLNNFQRKIVKIGIEDANEKVRKNMKDILSNIMNFQKENILQEQEYSAMQSKVNKNRSTTKVILTAKNMNKESQSSRYPTQLKISNIMSLDTSMNQSIIADNFKSIKNGKSYDYIALEEYRMHLNLLKNNNSWAMITINYQQIFILISKGILKYFNNDQLYRQTLQLLFPFTAQKRNKMYQSCRKIISIILQQIKLNHQNKTINYCQQYITQYIQYIVKYQSGQLLLLPIIISLNPSFFVPKFIEIATNVKISKERLIILDSAINSIESYFVESAKIKSCKKINSIIKNLCQLIDISTIKQKELGFAAMAILSHFKNRFPQDVLAILLCQKDKVLSRIIDLASDIDQSLKIAVIDYINNLKGNTKKQKQIKASNISQTNLSSIHYKLQNELTLIIENKVSNLNSLGQLLLSNINEIKTNQFVKIFKIIQFLDCSDLIMQFKILLTHIAKINNKYYAQSLMIIVQFLQNQSINDPIYEHHQLFFIEILAVFLSNHKLVNQQICKQIIVGLINVYRKSKSIKKRNITIQALTHVESSLLSSYLTQKQYELIETYSKVVDNQLSQII